MAAPVSTAATSADAAQAEIEAKKAAAAEKLKKYGLGGYKPEVHSGNTVYCKTEQQIGSRFSTKQCRSYEQLVSDQQVGRDYTQALQSMGVAPRQ